MPPSELRVVKAVDDHAAKYKAAANQLQKSTVWKSRTTAIKDALKFAKGDPKDFKWIGVLESMGTTTKGNAYIKVRISSAVLVTTGFEGIDPHKTLIKNGSPDYAVLSNLKEGAVIKFLATIDTTGIGLTEAMKMETPLFAARFRNIEAVPGATKAR